MEYPYLEKEYKVHVYETGPDSKLNFYSLFNFLQDIASDHAVRLGFGRDDLMRNNQFWVLSRMYSVFTEWPLWGDTVIVKTWPNGTDKLFAMRNFDVRFPDGRHIASATSSWLILDQITKKVRRPDIILSRYNPDIYTDTSQLRYATRIEAAAVDGRQCHHYRIMSSDLDVNLHTNNVTYLKWIYDTYEPEFLMNNVPQSAEINYLAESLFDQEIIIRMSEDNGGIHNHSVLRVSDNQELCRIRIGWKF
jgi:medium-chain acyl-[acyl-carrier-protein] hydrolase